MIHVIGAGPVGCFAGYNLAKKGHDVTLVEEHKEVGMPVQCTGIVTEKINDLVRLKPKFIANKINRARIYSPDGNHIELKLKENILDRHKFDQHLKELALDVGCKLKTDTRFIGRRDERITLKSTKKQNFFTDYLVGADGPNSLVAKSAGMFAGRQFYIGQQLRLRMHNDNAIEFYPDRFAWVVPENKSVVRVGVAAKRDAASILKKFVKERIPKPKVIEKQAGLIPIFDSNLPIQKGNVRLVGDAATQVKATTGGGIIPGMRCAQLLAKYLDKYEKNVRKEIYPELRNHLRVRKIIDSYTETDWNNLISDLDSEPIKKVFRSNTRDSSILLMLKLFFARPSLIRYLRLKPLM